MKLFDKIKEKFGFKRKKQHFVSLNTLAIRGWESSITVDGVPFNPTSEQKQDLREAKDPIEVLHLLEAPIKFANKDLDTSIDQIKKRIKFLDKTSFDSSNEQQVLAMLKARKKYPKYAHLFSWKTTVKSKIEDLTKKYKLKHDSLDRYIKGLPERAITEMQNFSELNDKVTDYESSFSIIAPDSDFKSKDPILLAKSPFGEYYYILCAWDKEVSIVEELLNEEELTGVPDDVEKPELR